MFANNWYRFRLIPFLLGIMVAFFGLIGMLTFFMEMEKSSIVLADSTVLYVAVTGADGGVCTDENSPCATMQYAVDTAVSGDEIRVAAGNYTDISMRSDVTQVVYISKTLLIRGGYSASDWQNSYPLTQPTTLDAQQQGRVL